MTVPLQFTRHKKIQTEVFKNNAVYLSSSTDQPDFCDLTPENSRRFRALPAWFTLKAYGKNEYQKLVERNINLAKQLGEKINNSSDFTLLAPVHLNIVCFTLNSENVTAESVSSFLKTLNSQGKVFMTPTIYEGVPAIRAAFSNWRTNEADLKIIWSSLLETIH